jgi:uncharacterized protein YndB with AHSA1/START domain/class 3 adenylate cyclase
MIKPDATCLLIADISGYTEYLAGVEIDHAQDVLADLLSTVVSTLRPAFRLAKLEGDAAFCFAPTEAIDGSLLLDTIEHCYFGFRRRRRDVRQATSCKCNACQRIPDLNLKFVAHHGLAVTQRVAGRDELLGSDVILVHRLLKNSVVEQTGVTAYALLTDALVRLMRIEPLPLGMRGHHETYEHIGEITLWVHDLERRWQEEDARARVYVRPDQAMLDTAVDIAAPPQLVWQVLTTPGRRINWQHGSTRIDEQPVAGGRRGVGMTTHCIHGADAIIEEILDWRPFDYLTERSQFFHDGPRAVTTIELEPTASGTRMHYRVAPPRTARERRQLDGLERQLTADLMESLDAFVAATVSAAAELPSTAAEPTLPEPSSRDGFLAGLQPIEYVG